MVPADSPPHPLRLAALLALGLWSSSRSVSRKVDSATAFAKALNSQPLALYTCTRECYPVEQNSLRPRTDPAPFFSVQRGAKPVIKGTQRGLAGVSFPFHSPGQLCGITQFPFLRLRPRHFWRRPPLGRLFPPVTPMLTEALSGRRGAGWWLLPLRLQCAVLLARWRGAGDDGGSGACDAAAFVTFGQGSDRQET